MIDLILWMAALAAAPGIAAEPGESAITAPGPQGALSGTLTLPVRGDGPVVLIIPGSGPTDRDGNNPLGVRASTYRLLAAGLADHGIASVRIDKRGMFGSAAAIADSNAVTIADYADDVRAWVAATRARTGASCVWLLGHSEGGLVALAARGDPDICGLILVAAPGRPVAEAMRDQLRANPANAPILEQAMAAIASLEGGSRVNNADMAPALRGLFAPQLQGFLISLFSYDPAAMLAGYPKPVLVLQGRRDIQLSEQDARRLAAAAANATLVLLPEANHVLKSVASDDRAANIATYANPDLPLAPGVIDAIATMVTSPAPQ